MADVVVTVPKTFGLDRWIAEGDAAGTTWRGDKEYHFFLGGPVPDMKADDRVYIVFNGRLRGFAPLVRIDPQRNGFSLVRWGGAKAVTIDETIVGFRGFRYRWWDRSIERPFPDWMKP